MTVTTYELHASQTQALMVVMVVRSERGEGGVQEVEVGWR